MLLLKSQKCLLRSNSYKVSVSFIMNLYLTSQTCGLVMKVTGYCYLLFLFWVLEMDKLESEVLDLWVASRDNKKLWESLFGSSWCISSLLKFCKSTILGLSLVNLFLGVALWFWFYNDIKHAFCVQLFLLWPSSSS